MKNLKSIFLSIFLLALIFACSKSSTTVTAKTPAEYLAGTSSKSWKASTASAQNGNITTDLFSIPTLNQPCLIDNILVIKTNGTYEFREGTTKCATTDPDLIFTSNWTLSADGKTFHVDKFKIVGLEKDNIDFTVLELTDSSLKAKTSLTISGTAYDVTITFIPA